MRVGEEERRGEALGMFGNMAAIPRLSGKKPDTGTFTYFTTSKGLIVGRAFE